MAYTQCPTCTITYPKSDADGCPVCKVPHPIIQEIAAMRTVQVEETLEHIEHQAEFVSTEWASENESLSEVSDESTESMIVQEKGNANEALIHDNRISRLDEELESMALGTRNEGPDEDIVSTNTELKTLDEPNASAKDKKKKKRIEKAKNNATTTAPVDKIEQKKMAKKAKKARQKENKLKGNAPKKVTAQLELPEPVPKSKLKEPSEEWNVVAKKGAAKAAKRMNGETSLASIGRQFVNASSYLARQNEIERENSGREAIQVRFGMGGAKHQSRRTIARNLLD